MLNSELVARVVAAREPPEPASAPAASPAGEKARIMTILSDPSAEGREALAQRLAYQTDLPAAEAISMIQAAGTGATPAVAPGAFPPAAAAAPAVDYSALWEKVVSKVNAPIVAQKAQLALK